MTRFLIKAITIYNKTTRLARRALRPSAALEMIASNISGIETSISIILCLAVYICEFNAMLSRKIFKRFKLMFLLKYYGKKLKCSIIIKEEVTEGDHSNIFMFPFRAI